MCVQKDIYSFNIYLIIKIELNDIFILSCNAKV